MRTQRESSRERERERENVPCVFVLTSGEELTDLAQGLYRVVCVCAARSADDERHPADTTSPPPPHNLDGLPGVYTADQAG